MRTANPALPALPALLLALAATAAPADYREPGPDVRLLHLQQLIEAGRAAEALPELADLHAAEPGNADILSLLGFAHRRLGDTEAARAWYGRALARDGAHRGALEYLGEMEAGLGRLAEARALLARLAAACPEGCAELDELRAAIAAAE